MAWIDELFKQMVELGASDLHMTSGMKPMWRLDGEMMMHENCPEISAEQMQQILFEIAPEANQKQFAEENDTDFAYELAGYGRFRSNFFQDNTGPGAVFRLIPSEILTAEQLALPPAIMDLCNLTKGLVVVTGPTGSGKSTTLAAMINSINEKRKDHIITIEDPIEFVHKPKSCLINQREVGTHTQGFKRALRAALREDPDIVLVGEMRDLETVEIAIETAETGHLVFGTLHTSTAASTVDRIIDQFSAERQAQIRTMLSSSLKGVIAQTLCKKKEGGRVAALEVLIVNSAVASQIRDGKTHQIKNVMQTGGKQGMQMLNDALMDLVNNGSVEPKEALMKSMDKEDMKSKLQSIGVKVDTLFSDDAKPSYSSPAAAPNAPAMNRAPQQQPQDDRFGGNFPEEKAAPAARAPRPQTPPREEPNAPLPTRDESPEPASPSEPQVEKTGSSDPFESFKQKRRP